jgi:hypothetical protein
MKKILTLVVLFFFTGFAFSQNAADEGFSADRPGFATPPNIQNSNTLQVETGASFERSTGNGSFYEIFGYNTTLLRYGVNRNFEFRVQENYLGIKTDSTNISGFGPLVLGTKILFTEETKWILSASIMLDLTLPYIGDEHFRPDYLAPSFYLLLQKSFMKKIILCVNAGLEYYGFSPRPAEFVAVNAGYSITEKVSCFLENYNWFTGNAAPRNFLDAGFTWMVRKNLQLDISGGMRLEDISDYWMISAGVTWRIPH